MIDEKSYSEFVQKVKDNYKEKDIEEDDTGKKLLFLVEYGITIPSLIVDIYQFFYDIQEDNDSQENLYKRLDFLYKKARKIIKNKITKKK